MEIICTNLLNKDIPSWTYPRRLYNDPRMKFKFDSTAESSLLINNTRASDAGQYGCSIDHEYNDKNFHFNKTIEVIVNEISDVKVEKKKDDIKLLCNVQSYPSPKIIWKIDYDNKELNPRPEEPDPDEDYPLAPEEKVVVDKSGRRWTLGPHKGVNNTELIIADVTENDSGKYYCLAKNLAGDAEKSLYYHFRMKEEETKDFVKMTDTSRMSKITTTLLMASIVISFLITLSL
ncbi:hypothetical protein B566_EDAN013575 [Ephemera danica]|nr:hypothetical protein B566_EDAN013575 [Ephemera danica]